MKSILICPGERPEVAALSESVPLSNVLILGKSLIEYWIEHLCILGAKEICILATDRPEQVRALVGDGKRWGVQVSVSPEIRELTVAEARSRYADDTEMLPAPEDVIVIDHLPDLAAVEQLAEAPAVDAAIVADDREALNAALDDGVDQVLGNPAQPEAAGDDRHVVVQKAGERVTGAGTYFLQRLSPCSACASIINT